MNELSIVHYTGKERLGWLMKSAGWNERQIEGQLRAIHKLAKEDDGEVLVAKAGNKLFGYISVEFHKWNTLGQIQGLIVHPGQRRKGIGAQLINEVEDFIRNKGARGIYVDTPVDNDGGRKFYAAIGYKEDCIRSEYYDTGVDAVIYLRMFK
jgi:ribosomal protein S18 acetylase RimI-like enzyme